MFKITMKYLFLLGVNIIPGMEKFRQELFSKRKTVVLMVGKQFGKQFKMYLSDSY